MNVDAAEHSGSFAVAARMSAVEQALAGPQLTAVAVGALLLWGRMEFGQGWMQRCAGLRG